MKSKLGHIYLYVSDLSKSYSFYKKILDYLGYKEIVNQDWGFAFGNKGMSIWFEKVGDKHVKDGYNRKRVGLNHIAFRVETKEAVDKFNSDILSKSNVKALYKSPRKFPEYSKDYYAVYFEDPDRIKLEVAYYS